MIALAVTSGVDARSEADAWLRAGGRDTWLQIREKQLGGRELVAWIDHLLPLAEAVGATLLVNDRVDVASLYGGRVGVHLPERGLPIGAARRGLPPRTRIGASVHDPADVASRLAAGADYVTLAPIFQTPGKGSPLGVAALSALTGPARARVIALGGIDADRVAELPHDLLGIAAVRAAWDAASGDGPGSAFRRAVRSLRASRDPA